MHLAWWNISNMVELMKKAILLSRNIQSIIPSNWIDCFSASLHRETLFSARDLILLSQLFRIYSSLVILWLRLHASNAEDAGLIIGRGTIIPHVMQFCQKKENKKVLTFGSYYFFVKFYLLILKWRISISLLWTLCSFRFIITGLFYFSSNNVIDSLCACLLRPMQKITSEKY